MSEGQLKLADGRRLSIDRKGYLNNADDWDLSVAEHMAEQDGISLTEDHLRVLEIFRVYFNTYEIEPPMRALVRLVGEQLGSEKANSRFLYRLFPAGPIIQASRYAGLPRPLSCI